MVQGSVSAPSPNEMPGNKCKQYYLYAGMERMVSMVIQYMLLEASLKRNKYIKDCDNYSVLKKRKVDCYI